MAVVLGFRIAIVLTPIVYRWVAAGGATYSGAIEHGLVQYADRLRDPGEDPDALGEEMSAGYPESGAAFSVTDFTGTFELRKLQWRLSRSVAGTIVEDQDVMTFHFIRVTSGSPVAWTDATDLAAVETAIGTYWNSLKVFFPTWMHSDQFRWYKDGPAFWALNSDSTKYVPVIPNPAIRVTEVDVAGTASGSSFQSPQAAMSVTEKCSSRKNWGRWYLPAPTAGLLDATGHIPTSTVDDFTGYAVTFYNACRAAGVVPVVWSIPKVARTTSTGGSLPAQAGIAFEVTSLQMDNLWDVIRRRRYSQPTYRKSTVLT